MLQSSSPLHFLATMARAKPTFVPFPWVFAKISSLASKSPISGAEAEMPRRRSLPHSDRQAEDSRLKWLLVVTIDMMMSALFVD